MPVTLTPTLKDAIRAAQVAGIPQHVQARWGGMHPSALSQFLHEIADVREGDPRIVRLGAALGVPPDQCFAVTAEHLTAVSA